MRKILSIISCLAILFLYGCVNQTTVTNKDQIKSGVSLIHDSNPEIAGRKAVEEALKKLGNNDADLIIVYVDYKVENNNVADFYKKINAVFKGAKAAAKNNPIIGTCATAGIITSAGTGKNNSVGVIAMKTSGNAQIKIAKVENVLNNIDKAGLDLGKKLKTEKNAAMLLFTDSNISHNKPQIGKFLSSLSSVISVPIVGGNSTGFNDFNAPVFFQDRLYDKSAIGVMISGDFKIGTAYANNFDFIHKNPLVITKSEGRKVYELNGKPIDQVVESLTGVNREGQKNITSALKNIFTYKIEGRPFIRFQRALKVDKKGAYYDGWPNNMPKGREIYIAKYNQSRLLSSAKDSVDRAMKSAKISKPQVLFSFNCNGRSGIGKRTVAETKMICKTVGNNVPVAGYYACGEFGTSDYKTTKEQIRYLQFSSIILIIGQ